MRTLFVVVLGLLCCTTARGFDSKCGFGEEKCDGFAAARTRWGVSGTNVDEKAEHAKLWLETFKVSGLPASLNDEIELPVFATDEVFAGKAPDGAPVEHPSVRPTRSGASRRQLRVTTLAELTQLPDFSFTLWDWAAGNESCPPGPLNPDVCHEYFPHIGMLNSNHMVPQAQRFYEHYHRLALQRAGQCAAAAEDVAAHRERFTRYLLACEKQALALEAVGQHFLQDAWSMGHMWERWGGPEFTDFGPAPLGDRTLGAAIAAYTGIIHGGRAMLGEGFDDPMCAPHPGVGYIDGAAGALTEQLGLGDVFLDEVLLPATPGSDYGPQREALFGCAIDGMLAVYEQTARVHGPLVAPTAGAFDASRRVSDASCWGQRATNQALGIGFGLHVGTWPDQQPLLEVWPELAEGGTTNEAFPAGILAFAFASFAPVVGLPPFTEEQANRFARDAAAAASEAATRGLDPDTGLDTDLASGRLPAIAGIHPNGRFARGGPSELPASWADPFLPWDLGQNDPALQEKTQALNLAFADAHAADRCGELLELDLLEYRALAEAAAGGEPAVEEARCGQCEQMVAPHLRFGRPGNYDTRREAFCAFVGPTDAAFVYTDEDPATFTGEEPTSLEAIGAATRTWCGCGTTTTTTTTSSTTTTLAGTIRLLECSRSAIAAGQVAVDLVDSCDDFAGSSDDFVGSASDSAACSVQVTDGVTSATAGGNASFGLTVLPTGMTVSVAATSSAGGGGPGQRSAGASGSALVRCSIAIDAPVSASASAAGAAGPPTTFSSIEVRFHLDNGATLARLEEAGGETIDTFPLMGPLQPGFYEVLVRAGAEASLVRGNGSANASFTLEIAAP